MQVLLLLLFHRCPSHGNHKPLRAALCNVWEVTRLESGRLTDVWEADRKNLVPDMIVPLDASHARKLASWEVPSNLEAAEARLLCVEPGKMRWQTVLSKSALRTARDVGDRQ